MNRAKKQSTKTTRWWYDIYLQFGSLDNPPHPASEGYIDKETRPSMAEILDKIFERTDETHYLANIEKVGAIEKQSIDIVANSLKSLESKSSLKTIIILSELWFATLGKSEIDERA